MGFPGEGLKRKTSGSIPVGAHVWIYASKLVPRDVTPILDQIFSDMKYAGMDGIELMEQPLRKPETVKIISELKDRYTIPVIGISYGADMWDASKQNQILEDVENIMGNMAVLKARTFAISVGRPAGRIKTENELDSQAVILEKLIKTGKKNGIVINLHNHTYEVENNMYDLRGTLKRIPGIKLGPDLNWLLRAGIDPVHFLNEFRKNIVFLHLAGSVEKWQMARISWRG